MPSAAVLAYPVPMADRIRTTPDDERFVLARDTWRQFHGLCLDLPAPTQPEIDARLKLYQRAHEVGAIRHFGVASVLLAGIAKTLTEIGEVFSATTSTTDVLLFVIACVVIVIAGLHSLTRMRDAVDARALARRIDVEPVQWSRIDSMFADVRDPDVRAYLDEVRRQGRSLRRAEAAVVFERARGATPVADVSDAAFRRHVRGRPAVLPREFLTGVACVAAVLLVNQSVADPAMVLPPLFVLAAWSFGDLLGSLVELRGDPWELSEGKQESRTVRRLLQLDLSPPVAIIIGVAVIHMAVGTLA